jgi:hypothetical protein
MASRRRPCGEAMKPWVARVVEERQCTDSATTTLAKFAMAPNGITPLGDTQL